MRKFVGVGLVVLVGCSRQESTATRDSAPIPSAAPTPLVAPPASPLDRIRGAPSLAAALAIAKPHMVDSDDEMDGGTALLGVWASRSMEWSDVAVATAETSYALVQKDSATERGKRLCVSGMIVEIHVDRVKNQPDQPATYNGNLMSDGNVFSFVAVGDTGTLVAQSFARLCGVVTGAHR